MESRLFNLAGSYCSREEREAILEELQDGFKVQIPKH